MRKRRTLKRERLRMNETHRTNTAFYLIHFHINITMLYLYTCRGGSSCYSSFDFRLPDGVCIWHSSGQVAVYFLRTTGSLVKMPAIEGLSQGSKASISRRKSSKSALYMLVVREYISVSRAYHINIIQFTSREPRSVYCSLST
jgi:hypothetical protein